MFWTPVDRRNPTSGTDLSDRSPGELPTVTPYQNWGWPYQILPYIEQESLWGLAKVTDIMKTPITIYMCPTRPGPRVWDAGLGWRAMTDYAGNAGASDQPMSSGTSDFSGNWGWGMLGNGLDAPICRRPDGTNKRSSSVRMADITDGTSNTLLVGEKCLNVGFINQHQTNDDSGWVNGWDWDNVRWGYYPPLADWNDSDPASLDSKQYTSRYASFGSSHPDSFNVSLCDGSTRAISYSISLDVFKRLSSRNDQLPIDGKDF